MSTIVFDCAGVLFSWRPQALLRRCLPSRAGDEPSARHWEAAIFGGSEWGAFDRGTMSAAEVVCGIARRTGLAEHEMQALLDAVPTELRALPPTVALLQRLRDAGHSLYYLSNMPEPFAAHLEREHAFMGWFTAGVFSARVQFNKPEPQIFELAARRFQAAPEQLVFIDDTLVNVHAAKAAGWQALHFQGADDCERQLHQLGLG